MWMVRDHTAESSCPSAVDVLGHVTEIVGTSEESVDAAIDDGVARATGPADHLEWVEITGVRSHVLGGMHRFSVELRLGLRPAA